MLKLYCVFRKKYPFQIGRFAVFALSEGKENVHLSDGKVSLIVETEKKINDKLYVGYIVAYSTVTQFSFEDLLCIL